MFADSTGFAMHGIRPGSPLEGLLRTRVLLDLAALERAGGIDRRSDHGISRGLLDHARLVEQCLNPLPCEGSADDAVAVAELCAELLVGELAPLADGLLRVVVRRLMVLHQPAPERRDFASHREAATGAVLKVAGTSMADNDARSDLLAAARDHLRPLAARAWLEQAPDFGRELCDRLPADLLLRLAVLPPDRATPIHEALRAGVDISDRRLRARARRLLAADAKAQRHRLDEGEQERKRLRDDTSRQQRGLELLIAVLDEARALARTLDLPFDLVLIPRGLDAPLVPDSQPQPACASDAPPGDPPHCPVLTFARALWAWHVKNIFVYGRAAFARALWAWLDHRRHRTERALTTLPAHGQLHVWTLHAHPP